MPRHHAANPWLVALVPLAFTANGHAGYYDLTEQTPDPQECIVYDVLYPNWTKGIYIATYPGNIRTKEGFICEYYGGIVSNIDGDRQLIQYAAWGMKGKNAQKSGIDFVHAGRHMSWERSNWEGSAGGIKGDWPNEEFKPKQWYRFVNRVWTPADDKTGIGYAGIWMKDLTTGEWHHLATFKYPGTLTGFNRMGGFTEFIHGGASESCAVEFRNSYAMRNGVWSSEATFQAFNHKMDTITLQQPANQRSVRLITTRTPLVPGTKQRTEVKVERQSAKLKQPEKPDFFDPLKVANLSAKRLGNQVIVAWTVDAKTSPQLGYTVELLNGTAAVATMSEREPGARQCVLEVADAGAIKQARITISDIFGQLSKPVVVSLANILPASPAAAEKTTAGLNYRYYESMTVDEWNRIPDVTALTPKRQGIVAVPDATLRMRRAGYAAEYDGFIRIPQPGLYTFQVIAASGARLQVAGKPVVDADGYHSICATPGSIGLQPGLHRFTLSHYQGKRQKMQEDDFLQVTWSGPGLTEQVIPPSAFAHASTNLEPSVTVTAERQGAGGIQVKLGASISPANLTWDRIEYHAFNPSYDFFGGQGARGADFLLAEVTKPSTTATAVLWSGDQQIVRARLFYGNRSVDSAPFTIPNKLVTSDGPHGLTLTPLEHHVYPMAFGDDRDSVTVVGESMGLLTKPFTGNGTLIARLAEITDNKPMPDGSKLPKESNWFAGITLRANLDATPGMPLGGAQIPYVAVMFSANQRTKYCDSTMINGAGNQPVDTGTSDRWLKIVRQGADFTLSTSPDGNTWKVIKITSLPKMPDTLNAGFVIYSIPNSALRVHWARFDNISFNSP